MTTEGRVERIWRACYSGDPPRDSSALAAKLIVASEILDEKGATYDDCIMIAEISTERTSVEIAETLRRRKRQMLEGCSRCAGRCAC